VRKLGFPPTFPEDGSGTRSASALSGFCPVRTAPAHRCPGCPGLPAGFHHWRAPLAAEFHVRHRALAVAPPDERSQLPLLNTGAGCCTGAGNSPPAPAMQSRSCETGSPCWPSCRGDSGGRSVFCLSIPVGAGPTSIPHGHGRGSIAPLQPSLVIHGLNASAQDHVCGGVLRCPLRSLVMERLSPQQQNVGVSRLIYRDLSRFSWDSSGNGVGDLRRHYPKLPYVASLGVDASGCPRSTYRDEETLAMTSVTIARSIASLWNLVRLLCAPRLKAHSLADRMVLIIDQCSGSHKAPPSSAPLQVSQAERVAYNRHTDWYV